MANEITYYADGESPKMIASYKKAQETFKYFWRELYWEYRRIVPGLNFASVKVPFSQKQSSNEEPIVEHMWINEIDFDGELIKGVLVNEPNDVTNVKYGDIVRVPLTQISDWLFAESEKPYGGFTIQAMRSEMTDEEREEHDRDWGLDFGNYDDILIVRGQKEHPENLIEHPMSKNMRQKLIDFIKQYPNELTNTNDAGYSLLHKETIAGNLTSVEVLLAAGMDKNLKTKHGKTALDFAKQMDWQHIIPVLE